eukprot:TRINITY_DN7121_c0_g1_i10.p3 TRINITY_DN7121_c0_g1~~TRINITY_DN7121_c0_g1_i10.p3  ORF type:complete len:191 (+),score=32.66 TRINITY_DN7121_c0_g1_i10:833-1405(+)
MTGKHLKIEVKAEEDKTRVLFYVVLVLILVGAVGIICGIVVIIKRFCCKEQEVVNDNPFLSEEWINNSEARYNRIMKESPESFYDTKNNTYEQDKCVICLVDFSEAQPIRRLKCRHIFHKVCIEEWVKSKINTIPKCPTCNSDLTKERPRGFAELHEAQSQVENLTRNTTSNLIPPAAGSVANSRAAGHC